jgi:diguanylate cyclase (GGDEF)-like protein
VKASEAKPFTPRSGEAQRMGNRHGATVVSAAGVLNRRLVLVLAALAYASVFSAFVLFEQPGLGIGHFFYVPICLVALASDELRGAAAGLFGAGLYVAAVVVTPQVPTADVLTTSSLIRAVTFTSMGGLLGWYASRNRNLLAEVGRRAFQDFLTGIGNARFFDGRLAERCAKGKPFTLVLADLDDFGQINNVHGHDAGNSALCRVASALQDLAWPTDDIARIGGDEFAFVTHLQPEQARHVCTRLARVLAAENLHLSFGTTCFPDDGTTAVELFRKADDRLFAAKLLNRNRRTVAAYSSS